MTGLNAAELADRLFLYGLSALVVGALFYVLQSGFLTLFLRGFSGVGQAFGRKSRALQQEDERLRRDPAHAAWKSSTLHRLKLGFLGGGALLTVASLILLSVA
ncbi:DUF3899 domain-containing protein [Saccharibacillus sacchari]|uniref:DUF3899 domain-containing protein n=1 Tax=Saccharibacillus sacchari TaxID=456493 RepID=A0ACC6PAJ4_9BACL